MKPSMKPWIKAAVFAAVLPGLLPSPSHAAAQGEKTAETAETRPETAAREPAGEAERLHDLFRREWELRLREEPLLATSVGRHEYDHLLASMAPADLERREAALRGFLEEAGAIDPAKLSGEDVVSLEIFRAQLEDALADFRFRAHEMPFNADSGFHTGFARLPEEVPLQTVADYENYLARLNAWPRYVAELIHWMRQGLARGFTVPRPTLDGYEATISSHVVAAPEESVFWKPFEKLPSTVPAAEHARLREAGRKAVMEGGVAGYRAFLDFFTGEYRPKARTTLGASELPDGPAFYAQQVRHFTTLDLSPDQIHEIGLAEVARIEREMGEVMKEVGFEGDLPAFIGHLRTDPKFYPQTPEALLERAAWIAKTMDGKLPSLFGRLPRLPYTVEPVPDHLAPKYTAGRYVGAPEGGIQPGIYWVNTYKLETRPFYNLEALTLHEAVPGHHLQIA
jgi:uncharacterized protein (DUF885 family)